MKKSGFLTFCAAMLPGGGQMYHGYMKRGLSLMLWSAAIFFIMLFTGVGSLFILIMAVWAYAFFDAYNLRNLTMEQRAAYPDDFIPPQAWLKQNFNINASGSRMGKIVAWVLIGLGVVTLYQNFLSPIFDLLYESFPILWNITSRIPSFVVAAAIIGLGIWLLTKGKKINQPENDAPAPDDTVYYQSNTENEEN